MKSENLERVDSGLELFCTIFSKVSEKYRNEKILPETFSLTPIIPKLMQGLHQIVVNLKVNFLFFNFKCADWIFTWFKWVFISNKIPFKQIIGNPQ